MSCWSWLELTDSTLGDLASVLWFTAEGVLVVRKREGRVWLDRSLGAEQDNAVGASEPEWMCVCVCVCVCVFESIGGWR